jgi:hypothetical protein
LRSKLQPEIVWIGKRSSTDQVANLAMDRPTRFTSSIFNHALKRWLLMDRNLVTIALAVVLAIVLSGCGGGNESVVSTPGGAPSGPGRGQPLPTSVPPPPPPPQIDLIAPAPPVNGERPTAVAGGANFDNPLPGTEFPLTITAVGPAFGGDAATTGQGAFLRAASNGFTFTLNNGGAHVADAATSDYPPTYYNPDGQPVVALAGGAGDLDYSRFGYWTLPHPENRYYDRGGGAWAGGYVTQASDVPKGGTASYSGHVAGIASSFPTCGCDDFKDFAGTASLAADFGTRTISGSMTDLRFTDMEFDTVPLNDIGFDAVLESDANLFTGTTSALTVPTGNDPRFTYAVSSEGRGSISGQFFGPEAGEVAAVWTLSDGVHRLIGSLGAGRTGP